MAAPNAIMVCKIGASAKSSWHLLCGGQHQKLLALYFFALFCPTVSLRDSDDINDEPLQAEQAHQPTGDDRPAAVPAYNRATAKSNGRPVSAAREVNISTSGLPTRPRVKSSVSPEMVAAMTADSQAAGSLFGESFGNRSAMLPGDNFSMEASAGDEESVFWDPATVPRSAGRQASALAAFLFQHVSGQSVDCPECFISGAHVLADNDGAILRLLEGDRPRKRDSAATTHKLVQKSSVEKPAELVQWESIINPPIRRLCGQKWQAGLADPSYMSGDYMKAVLMFMPFRLQFRDEAWP